jgi:hypothetical protein
MNGVPDHDLAILHWRDPGGRGSLGARHTPSGITVTRECRPGTPVRIILQEVLTNLEVRLRCAGILGGGDGPAVRPGAVTETDPAEG